MKHEENQAFGKVYNKALDAFMKHNINFSVFKDRVNSELNKRVLPENIEVLIFIAMSLLLNQNKKLIYKVLEQNVIKTQVESGDYYPF